MPMLADSPELVGIRNCANGNHVHLNLLGSSQRQGLADQAQRDEKVFSRLTLILFSLLKQRQS